MRYLQGFLRYLLINIFLTFCDIENFWKIFRRFNIKGLKQTKTNLKLLCKRKFTPDIQDFLLPSFSFGSFSGSFPIRTAHSWCQSIPSGKFTPNSYLRLADLYPASSYIFLIIISLLLEFHYLHLYFSFFIYYWDIWYF